MNCFDEHRSEYIVIECITINYAGNQLFGISPSTNIAYDEIYKNPIMEELVDSSVPLRYTVVTGLSDESLIRVHAYFTDEEYEEFKKRRMLEKLSGIDHRQMRVI